MNRRETATVCALLASSFPAWRVTEETVEMWHMMLQDLFAEDVLEVSREWTLTEERNPTIAGIRRKVAEQHGSLAPSAQQAWQEVYDNAQWEGIRFNGGWSHPLITDTLRVVSYRSICHSENVSVERAQFLKAYENNKKSYDASVITSRGLQPGNPSLTGSDSTVVGYALEA